MICCHGNVVFHPLKCWFLMVASKIQNDSLIATQLLFDSGCSRRGCLWFPLAAIEGPKGEAIAGLASHEKRWMFFHFQNDSYFSLHNSWTRVILISFDEIWENFLFVLFWGCCKILAQWIAPVFLHTLKLVLSNPVSHRDFQVRKSDRRGR